MLAKKTKEKTSSQKRLPNKMEKKHKCYKKAGAFILKSYRYLLV